MGYTADRVQDMFSMKSDRPHLLFSAKELQINVDQEIGEIRKRLTALKAKHPEQVHCVGTESEWKIEVSLFEELAPGSEILT